MMATRSTMTTSAVVVATSASAVLVMAYHYWTRSRQAPKETSISPEQTLALIRRRRSIFPKHYSTSGEVLVDRKVLDDMLEAATWAPSHHLTEPWHFIIFHENRHQLGRFLAEQYKHSAGDKFLEKKYEKKIQNCTRASFVIGICCSLSDKNPAIEDICSVAAAVQNMHLVATSYGVGAYWSTSGIYETSQNSNKEKISLENLQALCEFLKLKDGDVCLGWMFVGPFEGKWPAGRRKPCRVQEWVSL